MSRRILSWFLFLLGALPVGASVALAQGTPDDIPGVTRIDAEGLIGLANSVPGLVMVDARIATDRQGGYIEDSVSLPDVTTNCAMLARIIPELSSPVAFYCNGIRCGRSVTSARIAHECGYKTVYWFRGGFEEWSAKGYPYLKE